MSILKIVTDIMMSAVWWFTTKEIRKEIAELIVAYLNVEELSGPEKKIVVMKELRELSGAVGDRIRELSNSLLDTTVGIIYEYLKHRPEKILKIEEQRLKNKG